jgi:hypothetical protein
MSEGEMWYCSCKTDEVDAIGAKRYESQSGGEREIQRTMLELLNQMDGFDARGDVKVLPQSIPSSFPPDALHPMQGAWHMPFPPRNCENALPCQGFSLLISGPQQTHRQSHTSPSGKDTLRWPQVGKSASS